MARTMVFIDHMNFEIALRQLHGGVSPRLDYNELPKCVAKLVPNAELIKTFMFIPKPDDFLKNDEGLAKSYRWATGMSVQRNFDVIEGDYVARPVIDVASMRIDDKTTYYKEEKGTDINVAIHALSKAFMNAYDIAIFMSADTDYLPVYDMLKVLGKIVIVVYIDGQYIPKITPRVDGTYRLDRNFFNGCLRN